MRYMQNVCASCILHSIYNYDIIFDVRKWRLFQHPLRWGVYMEMTDILYLLSYAVVLMTLYKVIDNIKK